MPQESTKAKKTTHLEFLHLTDERMDKSTNSTADVLVNGRKAQTVQMPVGERLNNPITVDISQSLNAGKNRIEIKRSGSLQFASVQAVANYYVPWSA